MSTPSQPQNETFLNFDFICNLFSIAGTLLGFVLSLTPLVLFHTIFKNKKKDSDQPYDSKIVPESMLICSVLTRLLWFSYWYRMGTLIIPCYSAGVNTSVSILFSIIYLYCYFQGNILMFFFSSFFVLDLVWQVFYISVYVISDVDYVGKAAMIINILMFATPGQKILTVMKTGDYTLIPIVTTVAGACCSCAWLIFGILMNIVNCYIPNSIGITLSFMQICVYYYYSRGLHLKNKSENKTELIDQKKSGINDA